MRTIKKLPSQEYLKESLDYDPETGVLIWKQRPVSHFSSERSWSSWNTRYAGKPAISTPDPLTHYLRGGLSGVSVLAHRVVWKWVTGEDALDTDHIDGNKQNNRFQNLRSVSASINLKNTKVRKDNKSGFPGVHWFPRTKKWVARIQNNEKKTHHIGYFEKIEDAISARGLFETRFGGYHENHGRVTV